MQGVVARPDVLDVEGVLLVAVHEGREWIRSA
jgi:hypothetical protein